MSWRTVAAVLVVIFSVVLVQAVMAEPLIEVLDALSASGDYNNEHFNGNEYIESQAKHWFNMGLVLIFGSMVWAIARSVRQELTRRGGGGL